MAYKSVADILILGVGERENMKKIDSKIIKHLRASKINVELLPTVSLKDLLILILVIIRQ